MTFTEKIRNYFAGRKRRKLLAECKSLRHAEDDLLSEEQKREFDAVIDGLAHSEAPHDEAMATAREGMGRIKLSIRHPGVRELLDLLLVVGAVAAVVIAVRLVILCFPVIVGVLTLLFLGYATCVGLAHIGSGRG